MSNFNNLPILRQGLRTFAQGLAPLDDGASSDQDSILTMKINEDEKGEKIFATQVREVPTDNEPLAVAVAWDGPNDAENPQNFSNAKKCCITAVSCVLTINATFASSAPAIASSRFIEEFGIGEEVSELITVVFLLGYVLGPIFWGSGSEIYGRRSVSMLSMAMYTILFLGQAKAMNFNTVLAFRFFSGVFAVAPLIVSGGILADIWNTQGRSYALSLFGGCVFLGPALGPLVGGFVAADTSLGWEWIFWVMMIFGGFCTVITVFFLPETYGPVLLTRKARRLRKADPIRNANVISDHEKLDSSFHGLVDRTLYRPWKMLANEPILILLTIYMSIVYGILYALFEAFPVIFVERRGLSLTQLGLVFIGVGIGSIVTTVVNLFFARQINKIIPKWKGFPPAEKRLYTGMVGSFVLVGSILWLGWTGEDIKIKSIHPAVSTIFVGFSISAIFTSLITYIVDTYLMQAATALTANTMIRSLVGSVVPLFTAQMFRNLGIQWAATFIAAICLVLMPIPFLFFKFGARIRSKSKFAPCLDLKIAKQIQEQEAKEISDAQTKAVTISGPFILDPMPESCTVNEALVENIQQMTNTISEVQYLLHEAMSSQKASPESQRELVDSIRQLRHSSIHTRRNTIYGLGQDPAPIPEMPLLRAPALRYDWSVQMGPIDLSAVTDLQGTALSFARMTRRGNEISPQVLGRKGSPNVLIMSWKTQAEAKAFYDAWTKDPPSDYATLSVISNF